MVTYGRDCGVDVECTPACADAVTHLSPHLADVERAELAALPPPARADRLSELWVLKVANLKTLGTGITRDLAGFTCATPPAGPITVPDPHRPPEVWDAWWFELLRPAPGHVLAAAAERGNPSDLHRIDLADLPAARPTVGAPPFTAPSYSSLHHPILHCTAASEDRFADRPAARFADRGGLPMPHDHIRPRVALIGAGPSGISAAYHLRDRAQITLYEREDRLGGHANTVEVQDDGRVLGLDTAFIVFNRLAYPTMTPVFDELGVEMVVHPGGFNFFDMDSGLEYGTRELDLTEEEVAARYAATPDFLPAWREVRRFRTEGRKDFLRGRAEVPMGEYLDRGGYSAEFRRSYRILLCSAGWSVPAEQIWEMPAATVIAFFMGHDEGGLGGRRVD